MACSIEEYHGNGLDDSRRAAEHKGAPNTDINEGGRTAKMIDALPPSNSLGQGIRGGGGGGGGGRVNEGGCAAKIIDAFPPNNSLGQGQGQGRG